MGYRSCSGRSTSSWNLMSASIGRVRCSRCGRREASLALLDEAPRRPQITKLVPLDRWQEPEGIAAMAVFLASNQGRNIAGQTINVDGFTSTHRGVVARVPGLFGDAQGFGDE